MNKTKLALSAFHAYIQGFIHKLHVQQAEIRARPPTTRNTAQAERGEGHLPNARYGRDDHSALETITAPMLTALVTPYISDTHKCYVKFYTN